ncbi:MAG: hypothetical protein JKY22_11970 [Flavobacteriaceae bacterium]|nr:hypothetical protein [Flavobacteriaceae bacterium]
MDSVRIICTDGPGHYPVVGFIGSDSEASQWNDIGCYCRDLGTDCRDIFFKPKTITKYANILTRGNGDKYLSPNMFHNKNLVLNNAASIAIATIEWEE